MVDWGKVIQRFYRSNGYLRLRRKGWHGNCYERFRPIKLSAYKYDPTKFCLYSDGSCPDEGVGTFKGQLKECFGGSYLASKDGRFVTGSCDKLGRQKGSSQAELISAHLALKKVIDAGLCRSEELVLFSDSNAVIDKVLGRERAQSSEDRAMVAEIRELLGFPTVGDKSVCNIRHIPGANNKVADQLAAVPTKTERRRETLVALNYYVASKDYIRMKIGEQNPKGFDLVEKSEVLSGYRKLLRLCCEKFSDDYALWCDIRMEIRLRFEKGAPANRFMMEDVDDVFQFIVVMIPIIKHLEESSMEN